jgi:hypothetical protein
LNDVPSVEKKDEGEGNRNTKRAVESEGEEFAWDLPPGEPVPLWVGEQFVLAVTRAASGGGIN